MIPKIEIPKFTGVALYDPATGLFGKGGVHMQWGTKPKLWKQISHAKNAVNQNVERWGYARENTIMLRNWMKTAIFVDVTTNQPIMLVHDYIMEYINNHKAKSAYYRDLEIAYRD